MNIPHPPHIPNPPSVPQMAKNLAKEVATWLKNGAPISSQIVIEERMTLCRACEFFKNERCMKCGCWMNAKTHLETAKCPIGKW